MLVARWLIDWPTTCIRGPRNWPELIASRISTVLNPPRESMSRTVVNPASRSTWALASAISASLAGVLGAVRFRWTCPSIMPAWTRVEQPRGADRDDLVGRREEFPRLWRRGGSSPSSPRSLTFLGPYRGNCHSHKDGDEYGDELVLTAHGPPLCRELWLIGNRRRFYAYMRRVEQVGPTVSSRSGCLQKADYAQVAAAVP